MENPPTEKKETQPLPSDEALSRKLEGALLHLAINQKYLAVQIYRLGRVKFSETVPTSAVAVKDGKLLYFWNRRYLHELSLEEVAFVCIHEAFHVACEHLFKHFRKDNRGEHQIWNIAADCVINDFLTTHFNKTVKAPQGLCSGKEIIGESCADKTAEAVYQLLKKSGKIVQVPVSALCDDHSLWGQEVEEEEGGTGGKEEENSTEKDGDGKKKGKGNGGKESKGKSQADNESDLKERVRGAARRAANREVQVGAGQFPAGLDILVVAEKTKYDWKKVLSHFLASRLKHEHSWKTRRKTTLHLPPDPYLPGTYKSEAEWRVALMVDTSGSMGSYLAPIISKLKSLPPTVGVEVCWFDTEVYTTTLEDVMKGKVQGGGGTMFQPPINWAESLNPTPDVYIMLTDGYAFDNFKVKRPRNWLWLLTEGAQRPEGQGLCIEIFEEEKR